MGEIKTIRKTMRTLAKALASSCLFSTLVYADSSCRKIPKKSDCKENRCIWKNKQCKDPASICPKIRREDLCNKKGCIWDTGKDSCTQRLYALGAEPDATYYYNFGTYNWMDASRFCGERHNSTGLPSVQTDEEADALFNQTSDYAWTNMYRGNDGVLRWLDGSAYDAPQNITSVWGEGEPDNAGGVENCVQFNYIGHDGKLNDNNCMA